MAASTNNIVGRQQRHSGSSRARNYSAVLPRLAYISEAVFDRYRRRMLMMESVGGYAHQLRDTHPPLAPPTGYMMQTPPFGCDPVAPSGEAWRRRPQFPGGMEGRQS